MVAECQTMDRSLQCSGTPAHREGQREDVECGREHPLVNRQAKMEKKNEIGEPVRMRTNLFIDIC